LGVGFARKSGDSRTARRTRQIDPKATFEPQRNCPLPYHWSAFFNQRLPTTPDRFKYGVPHAEQTRIRIAQL
jgi:hypothetical protein